MVHELRVCLRAMVDSACTSGGRTAHAAGEQRGSRAPTESAPEQRGPVHADGSLLRVRDGPARAVSANVHRTTRTPTHGRLAVWPNHSAQTECARTNTLSALSVLAV